MASHQIQQGKHQRDQCQLTQLDADIETCQSGDFLRGAAGQVAQYAGKAKPVNQAEAKGQLPCFTTQHRKEQVQRSERNRQGNDDLDPRDGRLNNIQCSEHERDRVGDGER